MQSYRHMTFDRHLVHIQFYNSTHSFHQYSYKIDHTHHFHCSTHLYLQKKKKFPCIKNSINGQKIPSWHCHTITLFYLVKYELLMYTLTALLTAYHCKSFHHYPNCNLYSSCMNNYLQCCCRFVYTQKCPRHIH